jgi:hypothetical protein
VTGDGSKKRSALVLVMMIDDASCVALMIYVVGANKLRMAKQRWDGKRKRHELGVGSWVAVPERRATDTGG